MRMLSLGRRISGGRVSSCDEVASQKAFERTEFANDPAWTERSAGQDSRCHLMTSQKGKNMKKNSNLSKIKQKQVAGFTLVEMLIVLLIISVLILLFVPNLSKQKEAVKNTGNGAVVKVVNSQAELYKLDHTDEATLSKLVSNGNITQKQADTYNEYYTKNTTETRELAN